MRLEPPHIATEPALRWVLDRAFSVRDSAGGSPAGTAADRAVELAIALDLAARIGARHGVPDQPGYERLRDAARQAAATELKLLTAARQVATVALELGVPLAFLKFAGLRLSGATEAASRNAVDVDCLVQAEAAGNLQATLEEDGWSPSELPPGDRHLPTLSHPDWGAVEIHVHIGGVRAPNGVRSVSFGELETLGLLAPLPDLAGSHVPRRGILVAHALVHGLASGGSRPDLYPTARVIADLLDLGVGAADEPDPEGVHAWIQRDMAPGDIGAAFRLCSLLRNGRLPEEREQLDSSPEGRLLRHIVAGAVDSDYRQALKLSFFGPRVSDRSSMGAFLHSLRTTVLPVPAQLDLLYGRPRSRTGYLRLYARRYADLAGRLGRSLVGAARSRSRRRP